VSSTRPYYRRVLPAPTLSEDAFNADGRYVGFADVTAPPIGTADPVRYAADRFEERAAAVICAGAAHGELGTGHGSGADVVGGGSGATSPCCGCADAADASSAQKRLTPTASERRRR